MNLEEAKREFIQTWGSLGSSWGIPRSMAQIHALLLASPDSLSTEEVMEQAMLSRGNVNLNMRELISWGLVDKINKLGERKEFFQANHDIWSMSQSIIRERKKREMMPVREFIHQLTLQEIEGKKKDVKHFKNLVKELDEFLSQLDQLSSLLDKMSNNSFFKKMIKLLN